MKKLRGVIALCVALAMLFSSAVAQAGFDLPAGLTRVEDEAFLNDASVAGLIVLPDGVTSLGRDALRGTRVSAVYAPAGLDRIKAGALDSACGVTYVRFEGENTILEDGALTGVRAVIAPSDSDAARQARQAGVACYDAQSVLACDGFYYAAQGEGATLLFAENDARINSAVRVPGSVLGYAVTGVSRDAFRGCAPSAVSFPEELRDAIPEDVLNEIHAEVSYYTPGAWEAISDLASEQTGADALTLRWNAEEDADAYDVMNMDGAPEAITRVSTREAAITGVAPGLHAYAVRPVKDGVYGATSALLYARVLEAPCVTSFVQNGCAATLAWQSVEGADCYQVCLIAGDARVISDKIESCDAAVTLCAEPAMLLAGMRAGVRAVTEDGHTGPMTEMSLLPRPALPDARRQRDDTITLRWTETPGADGYRLLIEKSDGAKETQSVTATEYSYPIEDGATDAVTFAVQAAQGQNLSPASASARVTTGGTFLTLSDSALTLTVGQTYQLTAEADGAVTWSTSGNNCITLSGTGLITAQRSGTSCVFAATADGSAAHCLVNVVSPNADRTATVHMTVPASVENGESVTATFTADMDCCLDPCISLEYLDAAGRVLERFERGFSFFAAKDAPHESTFPSGFVKDATRLRVSLYKQASDDLQTPWQPDESAVALVDLTAAAKTHYTVETYNTSYGVGLSMRYGVVANPSELLDKPVAVRVVSDDGEIDQTLGAFTAAQHRLGAMIPTPNAWLTDASRHVLTFFIGDDVQIKTSAFRSNILFADKPFSLYVGESIDEFLLVPGEMPLSIEVADPSILSLSTEDSIVRCKGLRAGETTLTVTGYTGRAMAHAVSVLDAPVPQEKPALFLYQSGGSAGRGTEITVRAENNAALGALTYPALQVGFYDENGALIRSVSCGNCESDNDYYRYYIYYGEYLSARQIKRMRYIVARLPESEAYAPGSPTELTITPREAEPAPVTDKPVFKLGREYYENAHAGDTLRLTVECLTPERLSAPVALRLVPSRYVSWQSDAVLNAEQPRATLSFTLYDAFGENFNDASLDVYAGEQAIGELTVQSPYALSLNAPLGDIAVGETRALSIAWPDGVSSHSALYRVDADCDSAVVDGEGNVTGVKPGWCNIYVVASGAIGVEYSGNACFNVYAPESAPTLRISQTAANAVFGEKLPVTLTLGEGALTRRDISPRIYAEALDRHMQSLGWCDCSLETVSASTLRGGCACSLDVWSNYSSVSRIAYLRVWIGHGENDGGYMPDASYATLPVVGAPDNDGAVWINGTPCEARYGDTTYIHIARDEGASGVTAQLRDGDGNVLAEEYMDAYNNDAWMMIDAEALGLRAGDEIPIALYINDEKAPGSDTTLRVLESRLRVYNPVLRGYVGDNGWIGLSYNADCGPLTYSSSNESAVTVNGDGRVAFAGEGSAIVSVTSPMGQRAEVTVYSLIREHCVAPNVYLESSGTNALHARDSLEYRLGTTSDPLTYSASIMVRVRCEFLRDGAALGIPGDDAYATSCDFRDNPYSMDHSFDDSTWYEAVKQGADQVRVTLLPSDKYVVTEGRNAVVCDLIPAAEETEPVFVRIYPRTMEPGLPYTYRVACLNPSALKGNARVALSCDLFDLSCDLSAAQPEYTFIWSVPEDIEESEHAIEETITMGEWDACATRYVYMGALTGLDKDVRIAVGAYYDLNPRIKGSMDYTELTLSSADESVVTLEKPYSWSNIKNRARAVAPGRTTVTATTPAGVRRSVTIVVYDPANVTKPAIGFGDTPPAYDWDGKAFSVTLVTASDLTNLAPAMVYFNIEALNDEDKILYSSSYGKPYYFINAAETQTIDYLNFASAYYAGARRVRVTLREDANYGYTLIDPDAAGVIIDLPDPAAAAKPLLVCACSPTVELGMDFTATFSCLNPASLAGDALTTSFANNYGFETTGVLSAAQPTSALVWHVPADWANTYASLNCKITNADGDIVYTYSSGASVGALTGLEKDVRLAAGAYYDLNPRTTGGMSASNLTISVADQSVAALEMPYSWSSIPTRVRAIAPGQTTVTVTSPAGVQKSVTVAVYDPASVRKAAIGFDDSHPAYDWTTKSISVPLRTASDLGTLAETKVYMNVLLLDEAGDAVHEFSTYVAYPFVSARETRSFQYNLNDDYFLGARRARITLNTDAGYNYTLIDPAADSVTIDLPDPAACENLLVGCVRAGVLEFGYDYTATFYCLNPAALGDGASTAALSVSASGGTVSGTLTAAQPVLPLRQYVPQGTSQSYSYVTLTLKDAAGTSLLSNNYYVYSGTLTGIGSDLRVALGAYADLSISTTGSMADRYLTLSLSDPAVVSLERPYSGAPLRSRVRGATVGQTTLTATTPGGAQKSVTVTVYDPAAE